MHSFMIEPDMLEELRQAKLAHPEMSESAIIRQALRECLDRQMPKKKRKKK